MTCATDIYWLEQASRDVPAGNQWLSPGEKSRLASMRFEKRRTEWSLGRWTAKRAVASCLNLPIDVRSLQDIELRAASSGAPALFLFNQRAAVSVSLSHRAGTALCVVGLSGAILGCDLELVESRDHAFLTDFFTADEQHLVERSPADVRPLVTTLLWSAKESALKALHVGLRLSTTSLEVHPGDIPRWSTGGSHPNDCAGWSSLSLRARGAILRGWWRYTDKMVRTVVFNPGR